MFAYDGGVGPDDVGEIRPGDEVTIKRYPAPIDLTMGNIVLGSMPPEALIIQQDEVDG